VGHVARMVRLIGKPEEKRPLWRVCIYLIL